MSILTFPVYTVTTDEADIPVVTGQAYQSLSMYMHVFNTEKHYM